MKATYDCIILGAGINGLGIAKELSLEGKSVLVIDKGSIGGGTSSHSSRLIHGGLRYLEHFHFGLVKESLRERTYLVKHYPELVSLKPFYLPVYHDSPRPAWMIRTGLWLYDIFSRFIARHQKVSKENFSQLFDAIKTEGLHRVYYYYDAKTDDLKLTQTIAKEAQILGCEILEYGLIDRIDFDTKQIDVILAGQKISTQKLVNATGPWIDECNDRYALPSNYMIRKVSGIHLLFDGLIVPTPLLLQTQRDRIFFVIPEPDKGVTIIGTTERTEELPCDEIKVDDADVDYLLAQVNAYMKQPLTREDIVSSYIGVRPLIESKKSEHQSSREYKLDLHKRGESRLLHVYGGKLTTFRSLAKKAVRRLS